MLTLAVVLIFAALVGVTLWAAEALSPRPQPVRVRPDSHTQHHRRGLPGLDDYDR